MRKLHFLHATIPALAAALMALPPEVLAQPAHRPPRVTPDPAAASVPFGPGERLEYQVKLGIFSVGEGSMAVEDIDSVRGHPTYRIRMTLEGGIPLARVDDEFSSWLDTRLLVSRRFVRDVHEVRYKSFREWAIYPEERRWERVDEEGEGTMVTSLPLDEISFLYYLRTLPLEVGDTYRLDRYFKEDGNPVEIRVLRKEERKVPAGTFRTIVVQPIIRTSGLFSEGGKAEVYLSDDEHRHVVYLRSEIPVVGSVTLHLRSITEGVPLNPPVRAAAVPGSKRP